MAREDILGSGGLKFGPPPLSHAGSNANFSFNIDGFFNSSPPAAEDSAGDDDWGDFIGLPSRTHPAPDPNSIRSDPSPSNGYSFDPFGFRGSSGDHAVDMKPNRIDSGSNGVAFEKPRGPLSLALFGEEEGGGGEGDEGGGPVVNFLAKDSSSFLHQKPPEAAVEENSSISEVSDSALPAQYENGSSLDANGFHTASKSGTVHIEAKEGFDDEDDWEFHGAISENGDGENTKERGVSELSRTNGEPIAVISHDQKPVTLGNEVTDKNVEVSIGTDFRATTFSPNCMISFPLVNGLEFGDANTSCPALENINGEFDDFGEFVDASSEPVSKHQGSHFTHEASLNEKMGQILQDHRKAHAPDWNAVDHGTRPESHSQLPPSLPGSIFSDWFMESHDDPKSVTKGPSSAPRNGTVIWGSEESVEEAFSNLYKQDQHLPSVDSVVKPAANGLYPTQKTLDSGSVNDQSYFSKPWGFTDKTGVEEKSSVNGLNGTAQKSSVKSQDQQKFVNFYASLKNKLCFLALGLLSDVLDSEAQEARTALQKDMEYEVDIVKNMQINCCLDEFIEVLRGPKFKVIESEYLLSRRLSLAEKDWKVAIGLLKETRLILKVLTSGSELDQSAYVSTWSSIMNACTKELRHGSLIWKQAVENNSQIQILSDHRGQRYIQALGEIYRVVQLLGLSARVYKPWMLSTNEKQLSFSLLLNECSDLWSSSGLEEAFWNLLGAVDSAAATTVELLLESIKHIQEMEVLSVQDCTLLQQSSICRISLLPAQMLPELKLVSWNEERCFLNVANVWANLVSHNPPSLPSFKFG